MIWLDQYRGSEGEVGRVRFAETGSTRFAPEAASRLRPTGDDPARGWFARVRAKLAAWWREARVIALCWFTALWAVEPPPHVDQPLRIFMLGAAIYLLATRNHNEGDI